MRVVKDKINKLKRMLVVVMIPDFNIEKVDISELKKHPRNYREHPNDQLNHIIDSISKNGLYKNIVIAKDGTILAGHGVVEALKKMGVSSVPVIRLNVLPDDTEAIKVLIGDNEISRLGEINDIELTALLKELKDKDVANLMGTGYDEMMLANLVMVSRHQNEIKDFNEAAEWVGVGGFIKSSKNFFIVVNFREESDKVAFFELLKQDYSPKLKSIWFPDKQNEDPSSLKVE